MLMPIGDMVAAPVLDVWSWCPTFFFASLHLPSELQECRRAAAQPCATFSGWLVPAPCPSSIVLAVETTDRLCHAGWLIALAGLGQQ